MAELQDLLPHSKKLSVLYIDNDTTLRSQVVMQLSKIFQAVDDFDDAYEGLNFFKLNQHDIVIVDSDVPGMDNGSFVRNIKEIKRDQHIILSSKNITSIPLVNYINAGITAVINKPFKLSELLDSIDSVMQSVYHSKSASVEIQNLQDKLKQLEHRAATFNKIEEKFKEDLAYERKRIGRFLQNEKILQKKIDESKNIIDNSKMLHDLTGVPNKLALQNKLQTPELKALIYLNIDNFNFINTVYGMGNGNRLLKEVTKRIFKYLPSNAELFHITADEFVILFTQPAVSQEKLLSEQILAMFAESPIDIGENSFDITFSIGTDRATGMEIFIHAITASKEAKEYGGAQVVAFDASSKYMKNQREVLYWIKKVKIALSEDRFSTYYQPIIDNNNASTKHYEVLCRLIEENGNIITADKFIPSAVIAGFATKITRTIIDKSFRYFKDNNYNFSINITRHDLFEEFLEDFLLYKCDKYNISPTRLYLEIVEDSVVSNTPVIMTQIERLRQLGFHIAVDDFGSEHSMFSQMLRLHADFIKIDHSFIHDLVTNKEHRMVVENIVSFAKIAGVKTVAEHVESQAMQELVKALGVDYSQGYFIGKPTATISESTE